jgi:hypothetical protein
MVKIITTKNVNPGARAGGFLLLAAVLLVLTIWRTVVFTDTGHVITAFGAFGFSVLFNYCILKMVGYTVALMAEKVADMIDKETSS